MILCNREKEKTASLILHVTLVGQLPTRSGLPWRYLARNIRQNKHVNSQETYKFLASPHTGPQYVYNNEWILAVAVAKF